MCKIQLCVKYSKYEIINTYYSPNNVSKFIERGGLDITANNRWIDL